MPKGDLNRNLDALSNLIHQIQEERAYSSYYLSDIGYSLSDFETHIELSNKALKEVSQLFCDDRENLKTIYLLSSLKKVKEHRRKIIDRTITPMEAIIFYNYELVSPIINIISELATFDAAINADKISTYDNFLQLKERVGLQRSMGVLLLSKKLKPDIFDAFLIQIRHVISEQKSFKEVFFALMDPKQKSSLGQKIDCNQNIKRIEEINKLILQEKNFFKQLGGLSIEQWLSIFNDKVDFLFDIEKKLIFDIIHMDDFPKEDKSLDGNSDRSSLIRGLPIFTNIEERELREILEVSHVNKYKKGSLLFLEGDKAGRFCVILEGQVKLFSSNEDGDELVIQILGPKRSVAETAIFLNSEFPVNAKVAQDARILSVPAQTIRDCVKRNSSLANNALSSLASQSNELIHQIGQLTLKTARQRVGWFLLNLFVENDKKVEGLELPYNKTLISSYLGMKPETFSRTLQSLRDERVITSDKNMISLSGIFSLCQYCDTEIASKCKERDNGDCSNSITSGYDEISGL